MDTLLCILLLPQYFADVLHGCLMLSQEAYRQQLRGFMSFVDQQRQLPVLKQFLKLYTTISLPKLAGLMDTDEAAVKEQLRILEVGLLQTSLMYLHLLVVQLDDSCRCAFNVQLRGSSRHHLGYMLGTDHSQLTACMAMSSLLQCHCLGKQCMQCQHISAVCCAWVY